MMRKLNGLFLLGLFASGVVCAENDARRLAAEPASVFGKEYVVAESGMHEVMREAAFEPDPDVAFASGMLPHRETALEMAKIQLKYGKDPEMRKLAHKIITDQDQEIVLIKDWLGRNKQSR